MTRFFGRIILALALITVLLPVPAHAGVSVIRDEEIEHYLKDISSPIFKAAGLNPGHIRIFIIADKSLNAFVSGGMNMYIHTGLIAESDDPSMLEGVIAHETGHIAGGHLIRRANEIEGEFLQAAITQVLGIASIAVGAPGAGQALIGGGQQIAMRNSLSYSRSHEEAADQAGLSYLKKVGVSPKGLLGLLETLSTQQAMAYGDINPYLSSHPLSQERLSHIRSAIMRDPSLDKPNSATLIERHKRVVAKLKAFLNTPNKTLAQFKGSSVADRYARAVAYHKGHNVKAALAEMDGLIKQEPSNPYFLELKGQILYENARVNEAIGYYRQAVSLVPQSSLLRQGLATALLADGTKNADEAVRNLEQVVIREPENSTAWKQLGIGYGKRGDLGLSYLALAEEASLQGNDKDVEQFTRMAKRYLQPGTPAARKAEDIMDMLKRRKKEGKSPREASRKG